MTAQSTSPVAVAPSTTTATRTRRTRTPLALWCGVVAAAMLWPRLSPLDPQAGVHAAPFFGSWHWHAQIWIVVPLVVGAALVVVGPAVAERVGTTWLPLVAGAAASIWAVVVAAADGWSRLAAPLTGAQQYLPFATGITPRPFVSTFVARAHAYPTHVKAHPPGATLAFWLLDRVGLSGAGWAAVVVIAAWGAGIAAVLWAAIDVAGPTAARAAAPFVVLMPAVVWAGTSADALFTGVTAAGVAAVVVATGPAGPLRRIALATIGGALIAFALHMTYGAAPFLVIPAVVAIRRRAVSPVIAAIVGAAIVTSAFVAAGFWWFDGLAATRGFYLEGLAKVRPYAYFVLAGNLGALAVATGPAFVAGWQAGRGAIARHPVLLLVAATGAAVLIADVSGMSKAEVERIWLPFMPWLALGASTLVAASRRPWLAAQLALTLLLQCVLVSPW